MSHSAPRSLVRVASTAAIAACVIASLLQQPAPAAASTQIESFSVTRSQQNGTPLLQAGAHPALDASFSLADADDSEIAKDVVLSAPAGLFLNVTAIPRCVATAFALKQCPPSTQVGLVTISARYGGDPDHLLGTAALYALVSGAGETARLGFIAPTLDLPIAIPITVRTSGDYGLDLSLEGLPESAPLTSLELSLWAVPADSAHDAERFPTGSTGCPGLVDASCAGGSPSDSLRLPLLDNPTACEPFESRLAVDTYEDPGAFSIDSSAGLPTTGCGAVAFSPMLEARLSATETSTPSGLSLGLRTPGSGFANPAGLTESAIRSATVALPAGMTVNSAVARGLTPCTLTEFLADGDGGSCPAGSEIGSLTIGAGPLDDPLLGTVFFGGEEPAGAYRLLLAAVGDGMEVQLEAQLAPGPDPRRMQLSLTDLPRIPIDEYLLELSADAELLRTPARCGEYTTDASVTPWSAPASAIHLMRPVALDPTGAGPCPGPAETVTVSLSPPSLLAGSGATSIATATVTDAGALPVIGDEIAFASSDPGEQIGETTDNGDGTYSAAITPSTAAGPQTITATDLSVEPEVIGVATLLQLAGVGLVPQGASTPSPPPARIAPGVRLTAKPAHRTHDRTPTFRFKPAPASMPLTCRLDRGPFRTCTSPTTLGRLDPGPHTFKIRADGPSGITATTSYAFVVLAARRYRG